jgi:ATP-dependent RNA helicase RhlE
VQVVEEVEKLTKYMSVRTIGIFGGVNINTQKLLFIKDVTYCGNSRKNHGFNIRQCDRFEDMQKLVIDEFDEMLNLGLEPN